MKALLTRIGAALAVAAVVGVGATTASAGVRHDRDGDRDDAASRQLASTHRAVSGLDVSWLKTSVQGDIFEIRGGRIALQKSSNAAVRALAQRLISDHSKSLKDAEALAKSHGIQLEKKPTQSQQWELSVISQYSGKAFDVEYGRLEVLDHQQDISETKDEVRMGSNPAIVGDARKEIPMLRLHLRLSKQAYASANAES
jgi:putative membrane protein